MITILAQIYNFARLQRCIREREQIDEFVFEFAHDAPHRFIDARAQSRNSRF
jgi:hypothetical protein